MKLAFLGTSEFAVPALKALVEAGHDVVAVYTRAPKPAGRGQQERRTPVHELALSLGLAVRTPKGLRSEEEAAAFKALDLDAAVVVSYGHILPKAFLDAPVLGCINIHGSLLPRWRGAAPIHRAILAGDAETGVTIMRMDEGLDTGPMLLAERTPISAADTAETRARPVGGTGRPADRVDARRAGRARPSSRCRSPTTASPTPTSSARRKARSTGGGRRPSSSARCAPSIPGRGRGSTSYGQGGERIKVLGAASALAAGAPGTVSIGRDGFPVVACGVGGLKLLKLQRAGKSAQAADAFLRGFALAAGTVLAPPAVVPLPT